MLHHRNASMLAMTLVLAPALAMAQAPEGTATLTAQQTAVRVGDTLELQVQVALPEMPTVAPMVELPELPAFEVVDRRVDVPAEGPLETTHSFTLRARGAGTFVIGPWIVRAGDKELTTNAVTIVVEAPAGVQVIEESQAGAQIVERGYVHGQGRGVQYGAYFISPVYLTNVRSPRGEDTFPEAGIGVWARIGWEFPIGFTLEVLGGIAANGVNTNDFGMVGWDPAFMRADVGLGARYMFFNDTAFVPFIQVGGTLRWFFFDWLVDPVEQVDGQITGALHGAVGAQIELSPYFGIEAGLAFDYTFAAEIFAEGLISLMPFLGVTLYVYDESGN